MCFPKVMLFLNFGGGTGACRWDTIALQFVACSGGSSGLCGIVGAEGVPL